MAHKDKELLRPDRRVILADEEHGWTWAEDELRDHTPSARIAVERLAAKALPPGFLQKAARFSADSLSENDKKKFQTAAREARLPLVEWLRARSVLRDARNHEDGLKLSGCDLPVVPSEHADAIPDITGSRPYQKDASSHLPSDAQWSF